MTPKWRRRVILLAVLVSGPGIAFLVLRPPPGIVGRVILKGLPPAETPVAREPYMTKLWPNLLTTRHYSVSPDGGLPNVYVWIRSGLTNYAQKPATVPVLMEYRLPQIEPYVVAVWTNQPVRFRNETPLLHNAHCVARAPGNFGFNFAMANKTAPVAEKWYRALYRRFIQRRPPPTIGIDKAFPAPEPFVRVKCDVHAWEFAYICVSDHPFFALTDKDGRFELPPGLPPGRYVLEARHVKAGIVTQEIVMARGERKRIELALDAPSSSAPAAAPGR